MSQESIAKISLDKVTLTLPSYRDERDAVPEKQVATGAQIEPQQSLHDEPRQSQPLHKEPQQLIEFPWLVRFMMSLLLVIFIIIGATYFWAINSDQVPVWVAPAMTGLWVFAGVGVIALFYWMWQKFSRFSKDLSVWANQLLHGDFSSRMPLSTVQCPSRGIREHINAIATDYESLASLQQLRLSQQARHIEQKKHYLSVLYDVASGINKSHNLEDLLQSFLHTLTTVVKAKAATVRLLDKDDQMRLVASIGLSDEVIKLEDTLPAPTCLCGTALTNAKIMVNSDKKTCGLIAGKDFFSEEDDIDMLAIPLAYRGKTLGVYNLFVQRAENEFLEDEHELLESIGQHLGMAIEKAGVEEDARTLSIIEERTRMAHELHDSLAQTLASLRYKVRLFDDSLNQGKEEVIWHELEGLENIIDDAYAELRSLITHFRAPIDGKGVVRSVQRLSERFRQETDLDVFYYHNWNLEELSRDAEIEVVRIVQEALANIKKHAQASSVRILLSSTEEGHCSLLVEDDGIGLPQKRKKMNKETGEHIGLSVMRERAERLNGELQIDSDDGEGTLVQLNFDVPVPSRNKSNTESVTTNLTDVIQSH